LAIKSNIPIASIAKFETNERKPSFAVLAGLVSALNITADYLLGLTDEPKAVKNNGIMRCYERMTGDDRELFARFAELLAERNKIQNRYT
jgi:transcriptional regulator with XRE-family HTH domain